MVDIRKGRFVMIWSPNGGTGRTTIAWHLLVAAQKAGIPAVGLDLDPKRCLSAWAKERVGQGLSPVVTLPGSLEGDVVLDNLDPEVLAILDLPSGERHLEGRSPLLARAGMVLLPVRQGYTDMAATIRWVRDLRHIGIEAVASLHAVSHPQSCSVQDVRAARLDLALLEEEIPWSDDILGARRGMSALDHPGMRGREAYEALWGRVRERIGV